MDHSVCTNRVFGMARLERHPLARAQRRPAPVDLTTSRGRPMVETVRRTRRPTLALADVFALEGSIIAYIAAAHKVDCAAAYAFLPYAGWVAFATVLNAEILRLNPDLR